MEFNKSMVTGMLWAGIAVLGFAVQGDGAMVAIVFLATIATAQMWG